MVSITMTKLRSLYSAAINYFIIFTYFHIMNNKVKASLTVLSANEANIMFWIHLYDMSRPGRAGSVDTFH